MIAIGGKRGDENCFRPEKADLRSAWECWEKFDFSSNSIHLEGETYSWTQGGEGKKSGGVNGEMLRREIDNKAGVGRQPSRLNAQSFKIEEFLGQGKETERERFNLEHRNSTPPCGNRPGRHSSKTGS